MSQYLPPSGTILLAGTPIGDAADASEKLRGALTSANIVAAEDTRRAIALAKRLNLRINGRLVSLYEHNEKDRAGELIAAAKDGASIVVITDAGMPTVSDPGYRLVVAAKEANVKVSAIPGPSAVLTALAISGLPSDRFSFEGFAPRKENELRKLCTGLVREQRTMVFFESPRRVGTTLQIMADIFGPNRPGALCRELTKIHEEVIRAPLGELARRASTEILGEITLVIGPAEQVKEVEEEHINEVLELANLGLRLKDAATHVARRTGGRRNDLYKLALAVREAGTAGKGSVNS